MIKLLQVLLLLPTLAFGQAFDSNELSELSESAMQPSITMLRDLLSIPNNANYPKDIEQNVRWAEREFGNRAFETMRLETQGAPLLYAVKPVKKAEKTVLFYFHFDGQAVDTSRWEQESPYKPVLKIQEDGDEWKEISWYNIADYKDDWRIFARSASDDKSPGVMLLTALDIMEEQKKQPDFNIKIIIDFEEEAGSPYLASAVDREKELLAADMLLILDGPRHSSNQPTLSFGARGIATLTITTYGPAKPQHSGHYGNYAPNPALALSKILAGMKDDDGRVLLPGFYDGITIDAETEKILRAVPDDEAAVLDRLQLGRTDAVGSYYQESIQFPSLNILGMESGWIGKETRTIVPAWATAELDIRLVPEVDPERLITLVRDHITSMGYTILDHSPDVEERRTHERLVTFTSDISYQAFRTDFNSVPGVWLRKAMTNAFEKDPIMIRMSGGSIPIAPFINTLNVPAVTVPTVNPDNNQHSPNENLRLGNFREGIKTILAILSTPI